MEDIDLVLFFLVFLIVLFIGGIRRGVRGKGVVW